MMNPDDNYNVEEAGMTQLDDNVDAILKHLGDIGEADNTIVIFTTDNGAGVFTWPDGGMTPFRPTKGTVFEGGFRVLCIVRWPVISSRAELRTESTRDSTGSRH
jgi:arylsulfatase